MERIELCRVCLNVNVCHLIINTPLENVYEKLTGMPTNDMRPLSVCNMCYTRLLQTYKLKLTCVRAENLLAEMVTQLENTEQEVDDNTTVIENVNQRSATISTTDDDNIDSEVEDADIKQEILHALDVDMKGEHRAESPDITIGPTMIGSQVTPDEQERSLAVSCKIEETHDTRDTAAAAGDQQYQHEEYTEKHDQDSPVADNSEQLLKIKIREVENYVKDTKSVNVVKNIGSGVNISKLFNARNIASIIINKSESDKQNNEYKVNNKKQCHVKSDNKLRNDIQTIYLNKKNQVNLYICDICQKHFARKLVLIRHMRLHSRGLDFTCGLCNKSFSTKYYLKRHNTRSH